MEMIVGIAFKAARRLAVSCAVLGYVNFGAMVSVRADTGADTRSGLIAFQEGQFSQAFQVWHAAADHGDATAALYLGVLYDTGIGVPQDPGKALIWYQHGADDGSSTAMLNVGIMYDAGRGTAVDPESAATWYERAAARGNGRAEYNLALMYEAGSGVAASRANAVKFYRAAASHGISAASTRLHELGLASAPVSHRRAEDPAVTNFQQAQNVLLERGVGNSAEAFQFFRAAAQAGNALAAYNLAYYYQHGIGVRPNIEEAVNWYRRSEASATDPSIKELAQSGLQSAIGIAHAQR